MKLQSDIWTHPEPVTQVRTPTRSPRHYLRGVAFVAAILGIVALSVEAGYQYGRDEAMRECPAVKVVSTVGQTCVYASAYGIAVANSQARKPAGTALITSLALSRWQFRNLAKDGCVPSAAR